MGYAGRQAAGREGLRRLLPCSEAKEDGGWGREGKGMIMRIRNQRVLCQAPRPHGRRAGGAWTCPEGHSPA